MPTIVRRAARPLVRSSTYLRGVYLLLGGVVAIPYVALVAIFVHAMGQSSGGDLVLFVLLAAVTAVIAVIVPFVSAARTLEVVAARAFLGVELPDPEPTTQGSWESRWRGALWYLITLALGSVVTIVVLYGVPTGLGALVIPFTDSHTLTLQLLDTWSFDANSTAMALLAGLAGVAILALTVYTFVIGGALLARWAPSLLGPTRADQIVMLQRRERELAAGNSLARELHDSIGHALTAVTMQAGAAGRVLDHDPEFARQALSRIEETGRSALEELDDVLGILRRGDESAVRHPAKTLTDVPTLATDHGTDVRITITGDLAAVPPVVSREGYRVVQESITNAVRHGDGGAIELRIDVQHNAVRIVVENGVGAATLRTGGRGLIGMRERVLILGGRLTAGAGTGRWTVDAKLPWDKKES
ncbi:sensor histidine kinase [Antrihabitans cavernicola]|nr:histidine kinase [Spelaeibacter cavernicola]